MEICWRHFKSFYKTLYILLLGCLALPFLILLTFFAAPIWGFRYLILNLIKYLRPDLGKMVTATGNFFAVENMNQRNSRCVIALTALFEGNLTLDEVRELWFSRVVNARIDDQLKYPELQQYVTTFALFKFWKTDPFFDVRNHIRPYQFSSCIEKLSIDDSDLHDIHKQLHNKPFPSERSPWEILVIENLRLYTAEVTTEKEASFTESEKSESENALTLVAFRIHHCLADGYSIQNIFLDSFLGQNIKALKCPKARFPTSGANKSKFYASLNFLLTPFIMFYEASCFLELGLQSNIPWIVKDSAKSWQQVVGFTPSISIECIRSIKEFHKVSFTSVLVSAIAGAIRKSIKANSPHASICPSGIPIVLVLPVPKHPEKLRNDFTFGFTNIPVHEDDSVLRLKRCHELIERAKASTIPLFGKCMMLYTGSLCSSMVKLMTSNRAIPIVISNFPISPIQVGLPGHDCVDVCGSAAPGRGVAGALFGVVSYANMVRFSVTAEQAVLSQKDVNQLMAFIYEEIMILNKNEIIL